MKRRLNYTIEIDVTIEVDDVAEPHVVHSEALIGNIIDTLLPHPDDTMVVRGHSSAVRLMAVVGKVEYRGE